MAGRNNMPASVTQAQLRAELKRFPNKKQLKTELRRFATKNELKRELKRHPTKQELKTALEPYATKEELKTEIKAAIKTALEPYATKQDLETWGFALRHELLTVMERMGDQIETRLEAAATRIESRIGLELARHVNASRDEMRTQIAAVDDKYADLPDRVSALEHIVAKP